MRTRSLLIIAGVVATLAAAGCAERDGTETVTVETQVTVQEPPPAKKRKKERNPQDQTPSAGSEPAFVHCDSNIQAREDTTTCSFAQNTFWTYWITGEDPSLGVWSPAAQTTFATTCRSDGIRVLCKASDGGAVKFPQTAVDRYSQSQADAYAASHDLGPDPYEGLALAGAAPDYSGGDYEYEPSYDDYEPSYDDYEPSYDDYEPDYGENIPNYDEGRGYRVQCEDGTYSQSGGIQGACSHHGGVAE